MKKCENCNKLAKEISEIKTEIEELRAKICRDINTQTRIAEELWDISYKKRSE